MNIQSVQDLSFDDLRRTYKEYLKGQNLSEATVQTAYTDSFYLWRHGSKEVFWEVVLSSDFETVGRGSLEHLLREQSRGNVDKLVPGYLSHLRRFRIFLSSEGQQVPDTMESAEAASPMPEQADRGGTPDLPVQSSPASNAVEIPTPSCEQVELYLDKWTSLENYRLQEAALDRLFLELCPHNTDVRDILLKAATLNDFYSTNIFAIFPVAQHILDLNIDVRLKAGDVTLVSDIQRVTIGGKERNLYSFATKYCSHHNRLDYPIYDSYVDAVLRAFRKRDRFDAFSDGDLKNYVRFKTVLIEFRSFYGLEKYNLKQIDQYLWQLGKQFFPKNY